MRGETPTIPPLFQNCKWCTFIRGGLSNALSLGRGGGGEHGHSANSGLFQLGWGVGQAEGKERL